MARKRTLPKWYLNDLAREARARSAATRPADRKPGGNTDAKAREYALWILMRDGLDLSLLAYNTRTAHKLDTGAVVTGQVEWHPCAAGLRPRFVTFCLTHRLVRNPIPLARVELPNWSFQAVDLNATASEAPLALAA